LGRGRTPMDGMTGAERRALLDAAEKVHTYKLMQARAYDTLVKKAQDERTSRLLAEISASEAEDAEGFSRSIEQVGGTRERRAWARFPALRERLMMGILGTRGFFEWAIIAEDESVEQLSILAGNLSDSEAGATWTRIAADERLHIQRVKKEVLGMEGWEMRGGGGVRDVIFGANDGLVSILALTAGVYGAATQSRLILLSGAVGAVGGAISMGAGAYISSKSEQEVTEKQNERKGIRKRRSPEEERAELIQFYRTQGFSAAEAEAVTARVVSGIEQQAEYTIGEEVGLTSEESWPPVKAAVLTGLSFAIWSLVPILPFAFLDVTVAAVTAALASLAALFGVGASKAIFTRKSWVSSGIEVLAIGTLAAVASFAIGLLIPE
ncbi:MAG: VIT1/CCC1 transporter family protein, partial [Anaerolineae bacterium]